MIAFAIRIAAFAGIGPRWQRLFGWLILIAGAVMLAVLAWMLFQTWLGNEREEAVQIDRSAIDAAVANQNAAAREKAAWDQHVDDMTRQRERQQIEEAINASERDPDGDPLGAVFDRMR